jgi:ATP-dependent RNA helicase HrpB
VDSPSLPDLPIVGVLPELQAALAAHSAAVLEAPTGAGKSTVVPLALLGAGWLAGQRVVMLEPRRVAARAVATRMAATLGETAGETVGYRTRTDARVGPRTRIEVVTEGILTRRLQRDPTLERVGCVIFDEFHERSLQADLALALALDVQAQLRPELRIVVMSATLDGSAVARLLGAAPLVRSAGRAFPVETIYADSATRRPDDRLERRVAAAVTRALAAHEGDVLAFLPGAGEIRRTAALLAAAQADEAVRVRPLYGELSMAAQDAALSPEPDGRRKVVLATNLAETSLTIPGVRIVVDGGYERRPRFDPASGMSGLELKRISQASAEQRRGRAGRTAPGVCYRLWSESSQGSLGARTPPEILEADLASLALELACWGTTDAAVLRWLDPPPYATLAQAQELLRRLEAIDDAGRATPLGRRMAALGVHPRLAHMVLRAAPLGHGRLAVEMAALLSEHDPLRAASGARDPDVRARIDLLHGGAPAAGMEIDRGALQRIRQSAERLGRALAAEPGADATRHLTDVDAHDAVALLLAFAYPDRIGRAREGGGGRYLLSGGRGAAFAGPAALARSDYIVVAALDLGRSEARIELAAPLDLRLLETHFSAAVVDRDVVAWDARAEAVLARRQSKLGALLLRDEPLADADPATVVAALLEGIRTLGLGVLPWRAELTQWRARVAFARAQEPDGAWPDVSDAALLASLETWLAPWLAGVTRREHLARIDLRAALHGLLDRRAQRRLDELAPAHLIVPSGSRIPIDYAGSAPTLSVRLQEVFGLGESPRIAGGRVPVTMQLLSPARRPVQVTRDLASFWKRGYPEVRKELKGRYPKHYWPEDPHRAEATRKVRPQ